MKEIQLRMRIFTRVRRCLFGLVIALSAIALSATRAASAEAVILPFVTTENAHMTDPWDASAFVYTTRFGVRFEVILSERLRVGGGFDLSTKGAYTDDSPGTDPGGPFSPVTETAAASFQNFVVPLFFSLTLSRQGDWTNTLRISAGPVWTNWGEVRRDYACTPLASDTGFGGYSCTLSSTTVHSQNWVPSALVRLEQSVQWRISETFGFAFCPSIGVQGLGAGYMAGLGVEVPFFFSDD